MEQTEEHLRYPIGRFKRPTEVSAEERIQWIEVLKNLPSNLEALCEHITEKQLDTPYRPGGWNVRQVIHHLADSHMNCLLRFKLALTEDNPTICPYREALWAELPDVWQVDIHQSLSILQGVHSRLVAILHSMDESQFARTFHHPEMKRDMRLDTTLALYAWHSEHHLAHIRNALGAD